MKLFILFLTIFVGQFSVQAQDAEVKEETLQEKTFEQQKTDRLKRIRRELVEIKSEINSAKKNLEKGVDLVSKIKLDSKVSKLKKEYSRKQNLFIETITDVNLSIEETSKKKKTTFAEDIQQILGPILQTFKKVSDKPRKIQNLREKIGIYKERYEETTDARKGLEAYYKTNKHKELKWKIKEAIALIKKKEKKISVSIEDYQFRLRKLEDGGQSIVSTFSGIIFEFFTTKGKNLFLALIVFIFFAWFFNVGKTKLISVVLNRLNKSENREFYQWIIRPTRVIYTVLAFLVSLFLSVLTLYVLNDWVLVTLIIFVIAALVWSLKHYLPQFLEQSKIVLNLGTVREGERIVFQGLPWRVKSLGYYCRIINPNLSGGNIRVSAKELMVLNSRPINQTEPWFPTKCNDWVEIDDVFGKVTMQSPEQVIVKLIGGENKYYKAPEFYNMMPKNLSQGFSIEFIFGVDYDCQKNLFGEVIPNIKDSVKDAIYEKFKDQRDSFKDLTLEFIEAGASSLDLRFFLRCSGNLAGQKLLITRFIQSEFVRACNKYEYTIPFKQLTVHMSNKS